MKQFRGGVAELIFLGGVLVAFSLYSPTFSFAQEILIEDNGSSSNNQIVISSSNNSTIVQSNTSNVSNNIEVTANTGGNEASSNTVSQTNIETGEVLTNTEVLNSTNIQSLESNCCLSNDNSSLEIKNNGDNSTNILDMDNKNQQSVNINQNSYITNNIDINANSGNNQALSNQGNVLIKTGDVSSETKINNIANLLNVNLKQGQPKNFHLKISKNGDNSTNIIDFKNQEFNLLTINNQAFINNDLSVFGNSGNNKSKDNLGDVEIITGNIFLDTVITTKTNWTDTKVDCCPKGGIPPDNGGDDDEEEDDNDNGKDGDNPPPPPGPTPGPPPQNPPIGPNGNGAPPSGGNGGGGDVLGLSQGAILPATGVNWLVLFSLADLLIFLLGLYLRLHPGRDPNVV